MAHEITHWTGWLTPIALCGFAGAARAQVVNPADKQKPPAEEVPLTEEGTMTVTAQRVSEYRDEDLVGPYGQPVWTTHRLFPTTRVYVRPPGTFEFEYWKRLEVPRHGPNEVRTEYEFEVGLPGRFQVDMYLTSNQEGNDGPSTIDTQKFEVRWAFADWNEIWGNPTLYLEVASHDEAPDSLEYKLLFGGQISPGWHWGSNLVYEHETGGELTNEYEITAGVSRIVKDESLALGGELKAGLVDTHDDRGDFEEELLVGPSLQYRPTRNISMDFAPLVGIGSDSPEFQGFFVLGYSF